MRPTYRFSQIYLSSDRTGRRRYRTARKFCIHIYRIFCAFSIDLSGNYLQRPRPSLPAFELCAKNLTSFHAIPTAAAN
jgi:hypothetical protein